jgi:hypothetical protein
VFDSLVAYHFDVGSIRCSADLYPAIRQISGPRRGRTVADNHFMNKNKDKTEPFVTKVELEKAAKANPVNSIGELSRWLLEEKFYIDSE